MIKVGVLGLGRIGSIHAKNILQKNFHATLHAVCDPKLPQFFLQNNLIAHKTTSEQEFFKSDIDAVLICSPSIDHYRHVLMAIDSNKHIFCEKPLHRDLEKCCKIKSRLENFHKVFQIGFNRRFCSDFKKIAQVAESKDPRDLYFLKITSRDPGLPPKEYLRASGGLFFDMTIHDLDMARFIVKQNIKKVFARGHCFKKEYFSDIFDIDSALITLEFENGTMASIDNSRLANYGYDQRVELFFNGNTIFNSNHTKTSVRKSDQSGVSVENPLPFFLERYSESYQEELKTFFNACLNQTKNFPGIDDAIYALKVANACELSLQKNQPVDL